MIVMSKKYPYRSNPGSPSWSQMRSAFMTAIRDQKPKSTRDAILHQIADVIVSEPAALLFFQAWILERGRIGEHTLADAIGDEVSRWKDHWDINDEEYTDGLTQDPKLRRIVEDAVKAAPAIIAEVLKPDFGKALKVHLPRLEHELRHINSEPARARYATALIKAKIEAEAILEILNQA